MAFIQLLSFTAVFSKGFLGIFERIVKSRTTDAHRNFFYFYSVSSETHRIRRGWIQ